MIGPHILQPKASAPALPRVIGHRGAAGRAPENTLAGFRRAKELGCSWVEFDVRLTGDGALVLCHDSCLDRTTSGRGLISALPLATVRQADAGAGERVPTFDDVLALTAELGLGINIEIKADRGREYATAAAVAATIEQTGDRLPPAILASSFHQPAVAALRTLAPRIPRGILFRLVPQRWAEIARRLGCVMIGAEYRRLRRRQIAAMRAAGYAVAAYTVNTPARANRLFEWGVTSVFSDIPDIILRSSVGLGPARPAAVAMCNLALARQGTIR